VSTSAAASRRTVIGGKCRRSVGLLSDVDWSGSNSGGGHWSAAVVISSHPGRYGSSHSSPPAQGLNRRLRKGSHCW
jgi:hypothetical protein